jgi:serine/threonine-protein phosphatase 2B catalytic subunit
MHRWGGANAFPSVITVFSAPNYCGSYNNKGAVIVIENERMNIKQYKDVDHPFHLPGDIDLFTWSMPFLAEKITDMLFNIVGQDEDYSPKTAREIEQIDFSIIPIDASQEKEESKAANILRNKVRSIARM